MRFLQQIQLFLAIILLSLFLPLSRVTAENLSVSGTVPPLDSDFDFTFAPLFDHTDVGPNDIMSFEITYGAKASGDMDLATTIVANWSETSASDGTRIVDYVPTSATQAFGNTPAVINTANRTITWNISSLPAGTTEQTVRFSLKINNNYLKTANIPLNVKARMSNQFITKPEIIINKHYRYSLSTATSTNSSTSQSPTTAPSPTSSLVPNFPTTQPQTLTNDAPPVDPNAPQIFFRGISQSGFSIGTFKQSNNRFLLKYGTAINTLSKTIIIAPGASLNTIKVEGLTHDTAYFFQLVEIDQQGKQITTSDIYTVQTAQRSELPKTANNIAVVTSNDTIITTSTNEESGSASPLALLPTNTDFTITYTARNNLDLASIEAIVRNKVLGANTFSQILGTNEFTVAMIEKEPGVYVGNLKTLAPGNFEVFIKIADKKGNLIEEKIAEMKVLSPLSVFNESTRQPVADARVYLSFFNNRTNKYEPITPELFTKVNNPSYTNTNGQLQILLPKGKYKAEISAFGYNTTDIEFVLGVKDREEFPHVYLNPNPNSIHSTFLYYKNALFDAYMSFIIFINEFAFSSRFFNLTAFAITAVSLFLTFLFFFMRTHLKFWHLPHYITFHIHALFNKHTQQYLFGTISDDDKKPLSKARIEIIDTKNNTTITHTITNKNGTFSIRNTFPVTSLSLLVIRDGYAPLSVQLNTNTLPENGIHLILFKGGNISHALLHKLFIGIEKIGGLLFEFALICSLILELFFFSLFGIEKTLPFFFLSLCNILVWLFFLREQKRTLIFRG